MKLITINVLFFYFFMLWITKISNSNNLETNEVLYLKIPFLSHNLFFEFKPRDMLSGFRSKSVINKNDDGNMKLDLIQPLNNAPSKLILSATDFCIKDIVLLFNAKICIETVVNSAIESSYDYYASKGILIGDSIKLKFNDEHIPFLQNHCNNYSWSIEQKQLTYEQSYAFRLNEFENFNDSLKDSHNFSLFYASLENDIASYLESSVNFLNQWILHDEVCLQEFKYVTYLKGVAFQSTFVGWLDHKDSKNSFLNKCRGYISGIERGNIQDFNYFLYKGYHFIDPTAYKYYKSSQLVSVVEGISLPVYDFWFCQNIGHVFMGASLFWSLTELYHTNFQIKSVILLALDNIECTRTYILNISVLMINAINLSAYRKGITVYANNITFVKFYSTQYDFLKYNIHNMNEIDLDASRGGFIKEASDGQVYERLADKVNHHYITSAGLLAMKRTIFELCSTNANSPTNNIITLFLRKGSRFISNEKELSEILETLILRLNQRETHEGKISWILQKVYHLGSIDACDQIQLVKNTKVFIAVHGAECVLAQFMDPGSVIIELHPGVMTFEEPFNEIYKPIYFAAGLKYFYFHSTYATNIYCKNWYEGMVTSILCGIHVDTNLLQPIFDESFRYITSKQVLK